MKFTLSFWLLIISFSIVFGQDSKTQFSFKDFITLVLDYHPTVRQAVIQSDKGIAGLKAARGSFDPYVYTKNKQKQLSGTEYYNLSKTGLNIPTWYGLVLNAGYEDNKGTYLNPENNTPSGGLWNAGASLTLGKGLFIDKRRAALKKAKSYAQASAQEQKIMLNDLLYGAIKQYWKWVQAYESKLVYEEAVSLSDARLQAYKKSFEMGEKPSIDTVEAFGYLQSRIIASTDYRLSYKNQTLALSNYLWFENNIPLEITDTLAPPSVHLENPEIKELTLKQWIQNLQDHPEVQYYDYKLAALTVEKRLKAEYLKPKIDLSYNFLSKEQSEIVQSFDDYNFGITASMPLFLRKERGELKRAKLKLEEAKLDRDLKLQQIKNKVLQYLNLQNTLEQQIKTYDTAIDSYKKLLEGEQRKLEFGDSSLFLVNTREQNLIDAKLKQIKLKYKLKQIQYAVLWAFGKQEDYLKLICKTS